MFVQGNSNKEIGTIKTTDFLRHTMEDVDKWKIFSIYMRKYHVGSNKPV